MKNEKLNELNEKHEGKGEVTSEKITDKGEARYQAVSQTISNFGGKLSSWFKKGTEGIGRLWKKGAVAAFSTPEIVAAGAKSVETGLHNAGVAVGEGIEKAGTYVKEGVQYVGGKAVEGAEYVGGKVGQGAEDVYKFSAETYNTAKKFVGNKAEQVGDYVKDKALTVEAVASLIGDKTGEKLNIAKDGIKKGYEGVMGYGKDAINSASLRCQKVKEAYNTKMNNLKISILERKALIQKGKFEKTMAKLAQLNKVDQIQIEHAI